MKDIEEIIRKMSLQEAYQFFITITDIERTDVYTLVRFGVNIPMDIYDYFNKNYIYKKKTNKILHGGNSFHMSVLHTEMEARQRLMKTYMLEVFVDSGLTVSR